MPWRFCEDSAGAGSLGLRLAGTRTPKRPQGHARPAPRLPRPSRGGEPRHTKSSQESLAAVGANLGMRVPCGFQKRLD